MGRRHYRVNNQERCEGFVLSECVLCYLEQGYMLLKSLLAVHSDATQRGGTADSLSGFFVKQQQEQQQHFFTTLHLPQWHASFELPARLDEDHDVLLPAGPNPSALDPHQTSTQTHTQNPSLSETSLSKYKPTRHDTLVLILISAGWKYSTRAQEEYPETTGQGLKQTDRNQPPHQAKMHE